MRTALPLALATVFVVAAVALALRLTGSPQHQRELAFDRRRVELLDEMTTAIANHYGEHDPLPAQLPSDIAKTDPETGKRLEYTRTGRFTYRLCVTFNAPAEGNIYLPYTQHGKGRQCFSRRVSRNTWK